MHRGLNAKQLDRFKDLARSVARARQSVAGTEAGGQGPSGLSLVPLEVGRQLVGVLMASGVASPEPDDAAKQVDGSRRNDEEANVEVRGQRTVQK